MIRLPCRQPLRLGSLVRSTSFAGPSGFGRGLVVAIALGLLTGTAAVAAPAAKEQAKDQPKEPAKTQAEAQTKIAQAPATAGVVLAGHKAVYDLSLASSSGGARGISSVRGRIAYDFGGDACEGYPLTSRQVSIIESAEGEARTSDLRSTTFEEGDGSSFKFRQETEGGGAPALVDGHADRQGNASLAIALSKPKAAKAEVTGEVLFPSHHMKQLIERAKAGETTFAVKVFDGSDDGLKVYDTFSVIGKKVAPGEDKGLEEPSKAAGLDKLARWPVTITYFTPGEGERTPIYALSFYLFENGVSGSLKLDYGDFAVKGEMKSLDMKRISKVCNR